MKNLLIGLLALGTISAFAKSEKCLNRLEAKKVCIQAILDQDLGGVIHFEVTKISLGPILKGTKIVAMKCNYYTKLSGSSIGDIDVIGTITLDKNTCNVIKQDMAEAESL